jgi:hypothetical protein
MSTVTDLRFMALRAKGYQGSTNDMLLRWLLDTSAIPGQYGPNIHSNSALIGGDLSGPVPGIPTPIFRDTFTDTAGTTLPNHTPDTGASWQQFGTNLVIRDGGYCEASSSGTGSGSPNYHGNNFIAGSTPGNPRRVEWSMSEANGGTSLVQGLFLFADAAGSNKVTFGLVGRVMQIQIWQGGSIQSTETIATLSEAPGLNAAFTWPFSVSYTDRVVTFTYGNPADPEVSVLRDFSALTGLGSNVGFVLRASGCKIYEIAYGAEGSVNKGQNPPTGHTIGFNTAPSYPALRQAGGGFNWVTNPQGLNGRTFLQYELQTQNPGLEVGGEYLFEAFIDSLLGGNTPAASWTGTSGVTILASNLQAGPQGTASRVFAKFRIDDPGYTLQVRVGTGVTTNRSESFRLRDPQLRRVFADPIPAPDDIRTLSDAWRYMLIGQTGLPSETYHRNDYWYELLGSLGYEGSLNDREYAFWEAGGDFSFTPPPGYGYGLLVGEREDQELYGFADDTKPDPIGDLVPRTWENPSDAVGRLTTNENSLIIFESREALQWGTADTVDIEIQDFREFTVTWNGVLDDYRATVAGVFDFLQSRTGSVLGVNITPNIVPPPASDFIWHDPLSDCSFTDDGAGNLSITVAAGQAHDIWSGINSAPRLRWEVEEDRDFNVQVACLTAFAGGPNIRTAGLLVEFPGPDTLLRMDVYIDASDRERAFAASIVDDSAGNYYAQNVTLNPPTLLRWERRGDEFTASYSLNGTNWVVTPTQTLARVPEFVSLWGGNAGNTPENLVEFTDFMFEYVDAPAYSHTMSSELIATGPNWGYQESGDWGALTPNTIDGLPGTISFLRSPDGQDVTYLRSTAGGVAGSQILVEFENGVTGTLNNAGADWSQNPNAELAGYIQAGFTDSPVNLTYLAPLGDTLAMTAEVVLDGAVGFEDIESEWQDNRIVQLAGQSWLIIKVVSASQGAGRVEVQLEGTTSASAELFTRLSIMSESGVFTLDTADATFVSGVNIWRWVQTGFEFAENEGYAVTFIE